MNVTFILPPPEPHITAFRNAIFCFMRFAGEKKEKGEGEGRTERIRRNDMLARQREGKKDGNPDHEISVWDRKCFSAKLHQTRAVQEGRPK